MAGPIQRGSKYTVQHGDTLWDIASRAYGDPEDWDTIYAANKGVIGNNPNLIKPGQVLNIPVNPDPNRKQIPTPPPTPPPTLTPTPPPTPPPTLTPTPPPTPPPTAAPTSGEDSDSPLDWIEKQLGDNKGG